MTERPTHARGYTAGVGNNSNDDNDTIRYDTIRYRIVSVQWAQMQLPMPASMYITKKMIRNLYRAQKSQFNLPHGTKTKTKNTEKN